jgi:hypothetical protein
VGRTRCGEVSSFDGEASGFSGEFTMLGDCEMEIKGATWLCVNKRASLEGETLALDDTSSLDRGEVCATGEAGGCMVPKRSRDKKDGVLNFPD